MTHETEKAAEADIYRGYREKAVSKFREYVPDMEVEDSWKGVMTAVDYVLDHADRPGEKSGAVMAAAMWMHGFLEEDTRCRMKKLAELVDAEVDAALEAHESAPEPAPAPAPGSVRVM